MNEWLKLSEKRRLEILNQVNSQTGLPTDAIEKDWWVTITLKAIFSSKFAQHLVFKGGTSLSKAYNLIERFSEDIDLSIDRTILGFEGELSKTQIKKLRKASGNFVVGEFKEELNNQLEKLGVNKDTYNLIFDDEIDDTSDPHRIELEYNSIVEPGEYIPQRVIIELGARALLEPNEQKTIQSIIGQIYPDQAFTIQPFEVIVVVPTKTFLEKIMLLHEEFLKPIKNIRHYRMSRHLYDIEKLMDHDYGKEAIKNKELFETLVQHRSKYTPVRGISYDLHTPQTINFIPPAEVTELWKKDYQAMQEFMIYGETLEFENLISRMQELKERFL
ncbi:nucleotidyl transferase AbiEii/AbiGii toxin family protein [Flavobacterium sp. SUN046]|uniref:nucleotidyl transferase AbiEii/AbiGii toxin family protein n=1 Tax=Flavobacterium sp. SUN046 TaxID=3002440 RepID=UPI002DBF6379|nr:nucleotidyl transferase AbiEii/AbiGii toxin family protein [Flavobacterium sp. SUN046]MEC4050952.1 nucleotidyl transferase AbiEii/AbiGii toxin family protein [Flavobacterium sp. SUN046]